MPSRTQTGVRASRRPATIAAGRESTYAKLERKDTQAWQPRDIVRTRAPRSMTPPPGLGRATAAAATLCETQLKDMDSAHTVEIDGLPAAMLSDLAMEAMLEQACLEDHVVRIKTQHGKPCGSATLSMKTRDAANRCVLHFAGRCWDPSGTVVRATLIERSAACCDGNATFSVVEEAMDFPPKKIDRVGSTIEMPSLDMPAYVHMSWCTPSVDTLSVMTTPRTIDVISSSDELAEVSEADTIE
eukprot:TRINITY_DN286_c0_g1_i1.p1 TRINITY_DN286_c0_g1~~TRINITY_DN286_c0_g1_i1.p1  ORF type:complete len:269 (+),score=24.87 TRINITY_DN286_c0_g1_i1:79-807(+)